MKVVVATWWRRVINGHGIDPRSSLEIDRKLKSRTMILFIAAAISASLISLRVVQFQTIDRDELIKEGKDGLTKTDELTPDRGTIYDRNSNALSLSFEVPVVVASPKDVRDPSVVADKLAPILGLNESDVYDRLNNKSNFTYLARDNVTDEQVAEIQKLRQDKEFRINFVGIYIAKEPRRWMSADNIAGSLVGKVNRENIGTTGLEYQYESKLKGKPGKLVVEVDVNGKELPGGRLIDKPVDRGNDLILTIDRTIQYEIEQRLAAQIKATKAKGGTAIIMNTRTGEILAAANLIADKETGLIVQSHKNNAATDTYEPGSVLKLVTVAAAIDSGSISANRRFQVPDRMQVGGKGGHLFTDHDPHPVKNWSVTDILANSSNIGTIIIAKELGKERFDQYLRSFGFGSKPGLGMPDEVAGKVLSPKKYDPTSMGSMPIGQGISVSAIQMISAYNTAANGGVYVAPKLIKAIGKDGQWESTPDSATHRVISEQTAADVTLMLREVVRVGTGQAAAIDGYDVAGKTGTAEIPSTDSKGYRPGAYMASFAGFVPAQSPEITSMVVLHEPVPESGGVVSAPVFSQIAGYTLVRHNIAPPGNPYKSTSAPLSTPEDAKSVGEKGHSAMVPVIASPLSPSGQELISSSITRSSTSKPATEKLAKPKPTTTTTRSKTTTSRRASPNTTRGKSSDGSIP